jgi:hypothetical protein
MAWMVPDRTRADPVCVSPNHLWRGNQIVLNRVCEEVRGDIDCSCDFEENLLQSVYNDVLDFTGMTVTPTQVNNHPKKWRQRWAVVCKVWNVSGVTFCNESTTLEMDKEKLKSYLMVILQIIALLNMFIPFSCRAQLTQCILNRNKTNHKDLPNTPITNYQQMMMIFELEFVHYEILFTPRKLVSTIKYLADNKTHGSTYVDITTSKRRIWLRTWMHKHHY